MAIISWLFAVLFASLIIKGWHAVTRKGFLLHFLSMESLISDQKEIDAIEAKHDYELTMLSLSVITEIGSFISNQTMVSALANSRETLMAYKGERNRLKKEKAELIRKYDAKSSVPSFIRKALTAFAHPISECELCMSSFWGGGVLLLHFTEALYWMPFGIPLIMFPLAMLAVAGVISIIGKGKPIDE